MARPESEGRHNGESFPARETPPLANFRALILVTQDITSQVGRCHQLGQLVGMLVVYIIYYRFQLRGDLFFGDIP